MPPNTVVNKVGNGSTRTLQALRRLMKQPKYTTERLQAYLVPTEDAHQSEYIAACDERRAFLTGFTGSRGLAIVTDTKAAMWTDGRYFIQAAAEMGPDWTLIKEAVGDTLPPMKWVAKELQHGGRVGYDPYLFGHSLIESYKCELEEKGVQLVPVDANLVDSVWGAARPPPPSNTVMVLPDRYTGREWGDKLVEIRQKMKENDVQLLVLSALDEIAWLFNLRGSDIDYNPVFFAYAAVGVDSVTLFVNSSRFAPEVAAHLGDTVTVQPYESICTYLDAYVRKNSIRGKSSKESVVGRKDGAQKVGQPATTNQSLKVWFPGTTNEALVSVVPQSLRSIMDSPVLLMKAVKNETELAGMRRSHVKDAVAHCEFLLWIQGEMAKTPSAGLTEISAADKFASLRQEQAEFVGLSFPTISSTGPNSAMCHYNPTPESDKPLSTEEIYLVDSGAQYRDGTTDVTRTLSFHDPPTQFERESYTRVLKGHIALANLVFPEKTSGYRLDSISRLSLWQVGLDFMHGTGHGVGHYLNVHEGPAGFHFRMHCSEGIRAGMCITIEPGYYQAGKCGFRLENVYILREKQFSHDRPAEFADRVFLEFEPITLVPMATNLIEPSLMTKEEIDWLNHYHEQCLEIVGEELRNQGKPEVLTWLEKATKPLG